MTKSEEELIKKILAGAIVGGLAAGSGGAVLGGLFGPAVIEILKKMK